MCHITQISNIHVLFLQYHINFNQQKYCYKNLMFPRSTTSTLGQDIRNTKCILIYFILISYNSNQHLLTSYLRTYKTLPVTKFKLRNRHIVHPHSTVPTSYGGGRGGSSPVSMQRHKTSIQKFYAHIYLLPSAFADYVALRITLLWFTRLHCYWHWGLTQKCFSEKQTL